MTAHQNALQTSEFASQPFACFSFIDLSNAYLQNGESRNSLDILFSFHLFIYFFVQIINFIFYIIDNLFLFIQFERAKLRDIDENASFLAMTHRMCNETSL